jgi:hypothetical protein
MYIKPLGRVVYPYSALILALKTTTNPLIMRWQRELSLLSFLAATSLANSTIPLIPPWDDIHVRVKHTWIDIPPNWETFGIPPSNTTIDLHIALVPQYENALIDALYEVSTPGNPKHVLSIIIPLTRLY